MRCARSTTHQCQNGALKVEVKGEKWLANGPLYQYLSPQGCPTHSMAFKHNTRRWNLKKYAKRLLFKANFAYFGKKMSLGQLNGCKTHKTAIKGAYSSSRLVSMQMDPCMDILGTQTAQNGAFFGHFCQISKPRSPIGTINQNFGKIQSKFCPPRMCLLVAAAACCCCLLAVVACLLAKLGRKQGYKTKTGSTSSVTPTLTQP